MLLTAFVIKRSLSHKECPYDYAVAEATFKIIKTEFVKNQTFSSLYCLQIKLSNYVNWFNNHRIQSSLGDLTPVRYRINTLKKVVRKLLTIQYSSSKEYNCHETLLVK